jgi:hypothetical protein
MLLQKGDAVRAVVVRTSYLPADRWFIYRSDGNAAILSDKNNQGQQYFWTGSQILKALYQDRFTDAEYYMQKIMNIKKTITYWLLPV